MRRLRIAVWHNLPSGGGMRALVYHVNGLMQRGHHVDIWQPLTERIKDFKFDSKVGLHCEPLSWDQSICDKTKGIKRFLYLQMKFKAIERHCERCAEAINKRKYDIVFTNTCQITGASPLAKYTDPPNILYLQEPHRVYYEASPLNPWAAPEIKIKELARPKTLANIIGDCVRVWHGRIHVRQEINYAREYKRILVNSFFSRESILRAYGIETKVCELGIDTDIFRQLKIRKERQVINVGSLMRHKNHLLIIDAISHIKRRPKYVCVCNSIDDSYAEEVIKYAKERNVEIELRIGVTDEELIISLNKAKIMVYAPRLEPFGYAPLEANSCGLPVVAVAEGGIRETVIQGLNGMIVDSDPKAIALNIEYLLDNDRIAKKIGNNGKELVRKRWNLENAIDNLERNINDII